MTEPLNYGKSPPLTKRDMRELEKNIEGLQRERLDELRGVVAERNRLIKERDALRRFVGELEYYFPRWDGISPEAREWLREAVHKLNVDVVT